MKIRPAVSADLKQCVALDHNATTQRVWQLNRREENGSVIVSFHAVRLPRTMRVIYPRDPNQLWHDWRYWDGFFVAEDDGYVHGYAGLLLQPTAGKGWIRDLVVGRTQRRQGTGTLLFRQATQWAAERELHQLTIEVQSKNYPAIHFCQKHGFQFCGFNEYFYPNRDIALFFMLRLR